MSLTVITLKNVPPSLRGDLTKWMQEIATGVYVGNFSSSIRDLLWERICKQTDTGEATLCYESNNEIGYDFKTMNSDRTILDSDGIPLVLIPKKISSPTSEEPRKGFSNAYRFHQARKFTTSKNVSSSKAEEPRFAFIDLETTGLNPSKDQIIEIGAVKKNQDSLICFSELINIHHSLPEAVSKLTKINDTMLQEGKELAGVLKDFLVFIENNTIVGYNVDFDILFLNESLAKVNLPKIENKIIDLMKIVKKEHIFQENYKLSTSLKSYGIDEEVPHRALEDAKLAMKLAEKTKALGN